MLQKLLAYKGIFILVLVLAGGYYVYSTFFSSSAAVANPALVAGGGTAAVLEQELLNELLQLQRIRLDATIFEDPALRVLVDMTQKIEPQKIGRPNPFAPISGQVQAQSSSNNVFSPGRTR
jgi:hypothetical protein